MEFLSDLIKILLPAGLVAYGMYLVVRSFLHKEFEKKLVDVKIKNTEIVLPVRLQAYERMSLFLERITPHNLVVRSNEPGLTAAQFQQKLLHEIREEYSHNMSQQVYMSEDVWLLIKKSMEDIVTVINASSQGVPNDARGIELAKNIFEQLMHLPEDPVAPAMRYLKKEIRTLF